MEAQGNPVGEGSMGSAGVFFFHYLVTLVQAGVFVSLGQLIASAAPSFDVAQATVGLVAPILFLAGGMFSPPRIRRTTNSSITTWCRSQ